MSQNAAHRSTVSTAVEQQQQHPEVYTDDVMSCSAIWQTYRALSVSCYDRTQWNLHLPQEVWQLCSILRPWLQMDFKKLQKRSFLGRTAANALHPHPLEADSAAHPSQAGFFIKDELSDYRFLVDTGACITEKASPSTCTRQLFHSPFFIPTRRSQWYIHPHVW